jgi:hypothetical protein
MRDICSDELSSATGGLDLPDSLHPTISVDVSDDHGAGFLAESKRNCSANSRCGACYN